MFVRFTHTNSWGFWENKAAVCKKGSQLWPVRKERWLCQHSLCAFKSLPVSGSQFPHKGFDLERSSQGSPSSTISWPLTSQILLNRHEGSKGGHQPVPPRTRALPRRIQPVERPWCRVASTVSLAAPGTLEAKEPPGAPP